MPETKSRRRYAPICTFEGCDKEHWSKGFCGTHYNQHWRGVPLTPRFANRRLSGSIVARNSAGEKECGECRQWLPEDQFTKNRGRVDGLNFRCKPCAQARYRLRRDSVWASGIKTAYGLTPERFNELLAEQSGGCAICGTTDPGGRGRFHVDHDHSCCSGTKSCGRCIRGLLCSVHNVALGMFQDNPETLRLAAEYLEARR